MSAEKQMIEFARAVDEFIEAFEVVFNHDWEYTKHQFDDEGLISKGATFLNPRVDDESNNWVSRGGLLATYRRLKNFCGW